MTISLRAKLIVSFMAVIVVCGLISTLTGVHIITTDVIREAQAKVKADLNSAREIYAQEIKEIENVVNFTALRFFVKDAVAGNDIAKLEKELLKIKKDNGLDVLTLTDRNGAVIVRAGNLSCCGDNQSSNVIVSAVISNKTVVAGTEIVSKEELVKEGEDFVKQAGIKLIPTLKAKATSKTEECSGMMMKAAAPVLNNNNELLGVLYGGRLLNRDYKVVDKIKNIVYKDVKYKGKDIGTATIFQEDLRISTNVRTEDNKRAIGTRVSKEVYDAVLVNGNNWIDRAFVVNNWYITAYEPIRGIKGDIIGM
ncbi:MAG: cache domain-containing protein, partial [Candidatus Omnitrophica bacterium]|nr:cache domain-containing protein [Candidatus Omnitrophota bacterium]